MFDRGLWDQLEFWPVAAWPIMFTSILFALFQCNKLLENQGIFYDSIYKGAGKLFLIFYPIASIFDTVIHIYLIYNIGWFYLLAIPIIAITTPIVMLIFGFLPFAQYIMPIAYLTVVASFLTLIGVLEVRFIAALNAHIFNFLAELF